MTIHKRVVAYKRVSTDDREQRPERQDENLERWAKDNDAEITAWVVDEGTSARKVSPLQRQQVHEAIRLAKKTGATALLVEDLDRWCRTGNRDLAATDFRMEHEHGLDVVMVDMPEGLEGMAYEIIRTVKAEYAREFSDLLGRRISQGLALAKQRGFPHGAPGPKPKPKLTDAEVGQIKEWRDQRIGWRRIGLEISKDRGAYEVADPKVQKRLKVTYGWIRQQLAHREKTGCDISRSVLKGRGAPSTTEVDSAQGVES